MKQTGSVGARHRRLAVAFAVIIAGAAAALLTAAPALTHAEEASNTYPFPPGPNAALAKKVCSHCHDGMMVVTKRYDRSDAEKYYRLMVGDPASEDAQKIIDYLVTALPDE